MKNLRMISLLLVILGNPSYAASSDRIDDGKGSTGSYIIPDAVYYSCSGMVGSMDDDTYGPGPSFPVDRRQIFMEQEPVLGPDLGRRHLQA